ncbi:MAG: glycolate oxidase subunit GlcE, partial [Lautropia sp.]|nr:glycolate oxidase subunit GlcE [Lautropia sp.]
TELVVTVRAGTPLAELEALLATQGQCLAFEPPHFAEGGTVGGMVATGLAGPRRMSVGSVRDFILGAVLVSATGEVMRFGGQVMKNVAGYDISRLLVGSMGVLGLIAEVSLKVLPLPKADVSLRLPMDAAESIRRCNEWAGKPLPLAATVWHDGVLTVRLCGAVRAVESAVAQLKGSLVPAEEAGVFWRAIRDQRHAFFRDAGPSAPLWRLSVPDTAPLLDLPGRQLIEWGGALRWYLPDGPADEVSAGKQASALREQVAGQGGSATLFRADAAHAGIERFHPLSATSQTIHKRLKQALDPAGAINPGRLYSWM